MKTLIIVDHPSYDQSVVNRRWLDEVRKYPDEFLVHNLQSSYPRSSIDSLAVRSILRLSIRSSTTMAPLSSSSLFTGSIRLQC